jgi:hypothetical protein
MNSLLKPAVLLAVTTLIGCASNKPMTYKENHSEAYNIAHAGGLIRDIQDTEVPADKIGSLTESMLKVGFVGAGYANPQLGMTNWQTAGVHLLSEMLEPDSHGARNSLLAWMPVNEAGNSDDAQARLLSHVKDSVASALEELGASQEVLFEKDGTWVVQFVKDEWNCPEYKANVTELKDLCRVRARIFEPRKAVAPEFITGEASQQRYVFSSGHGQDYQRLNLLTADESRVPQDELYASISKRLPAWVYLYLSPGNVTFSNGEPINFPYILNEGKAKVFVTPEE